MTDHIETAEVLDGAADVIERDGWASCSFGLTESDPTCANGAIGRAQRAAGIPGTRLRFSRHFGLFLIGEGMVEWPAHIAPNGAVLQWNDERGRTKQEVLDALRSAAKDQRRLSDGIAS